MPPIITVENLSKQYRIGALQDGYHTLRETLTNAIRRPLHLFNGKRGSRSETIWALKDVSFEVHPGETLGLIGKNGAGKSTLLKILSQITEPTSGRIRLFGRIRSLLEVGTGFHPELTGRENVFLSGAMLGMPRAEIRRKFDEIVAFSEIGRFIDTPVKWYSSGMYVRLAFSVSAHLESEILVLDEVLAVGDASFQVKCLTKMQEIRSEGRTVIFVSHNMQALTRLCSRAIQLDGGVIVQSGPVHDVARAYLGSHLQSRPERVWTDLLKAPGGSVTRLRAARVRAEDGELTDILDIRRPIRLEMEFDVLQPGYVISPNFYLINAEGVCLFITTEQDPDWLRKPRPTGRFLSTAWVPGNFLAEGTHLMTVAASTVSPSVEIVFEEREVVAFQVVDSLTGGSLRGDYIGPFPGVVRPKLRWTTDFKPLIGSPQDSVGESRGSL
jgi:lipopolysaccharide transport system ATP-binding protein